MGYVEAFAKVGELFGEAKPITHPSFIKQDGIYLLFDGSKSISGARDKLYFTIAIAANSLKGENSVMGKVDEFRSLVIGESLLDWEETKSVSFETSTLYIVACSIVYNLDYRRE